MKINHDILYIMANLKGTLTRETILDGHTVGTHILEYPLVAFTLLNCDCGVVSKSDMTAIAQLEIAKGSLITRGIESDNHISDIMRTYEARVIKINPHKINFLNNKKEILDRFHKNECKFIGYSDNAVYEIGTLAKAQFSIPANIEEIIHIPGANNIGIGFYKTLDQVRHLNYSVNK